jgi:hypothetical protein
MIVTVGPRRAAILRDESTADFDAVRVLGANGHAAPASGRRLAARCVVEILRQVGGMSPRALLGGTWAPGGDDALIVEVGVSGSSLGGASRASRRSTPCRSWRRC